MFQIYWNTYTVHTFGILQLYNWINLLVSSYQKMINEHLVNSEYSQNFNKMNAFDESSNIYQTFASFYYLFKVFGLISFSFKGPITNGTLKSTFMDKFYPIIVLVIHLLGIIYIIGTSFRRGFIQNFISIAIFVNITANLISVLGLYLRRQNFIRFLRIIDCSDGRVNLFRLILIYLTNIQLFAWISGSQTWHTAQKFTKIWPRYHFIKNQSSGCYSQIYDRSILWKLDWFFSSPKVKFFGTFSISSLP
jgi:hypothetical protein